MVVRKRNVETKRIHAVSNATLLAYYSAAALVYCADAYLIPCCYNNPLPAFRPQRFSSPEASWMKSRRASSSSSFSRNINIISMVYAPPGSGYATPEDETSELPDSYEPMMEYPGTMRPGRTPENQPFHDLPLGDNEPDPIPWPHFQQIEWHHIWEPPHPDPIPMEEFIEMNGRWATPEMEAAMRAGVRRDVRKRREQEEAVKRETLILDDEDDEVDDDFVGVDESVELGDGIFGKLGSAADQAATAAAVSGEVGRPSKQADPTTTTEESDVALEDDDFDDFLLDLGLDAIVPSSDDADDDDDEVEEEEDEIGEEEPPVRVGSKKGLQVGATKMAGILDEDDSDLDLGDLDLLGGDEVDVDDSPIDLDLDGPSMIATDIDAEIGLGVDDDDDDELAEDGIATVPLDDFESDALDGEEDFFDSGFDYDEDGFEGGDTGDMW